MKEQRISIRIAESWYWIDYMPYLRKTDFSAFNGSQGKYLRKLDDEDKAAIAKGVRSDIGIKEVEGRSEIYEVLSRSYGAILAVYGETPGLIVLKQNNAHYSRPPSHPDVWDLGPKGKMEKGESGRETMYREVFEECAVRIEGSRLLPISVRTAYDFYSRDRETGVPSHVNKEVYYGVYVIDDAELQGMKLSAEHVEAKRVSFLDALDIFGKDDAIRPSRADVILAIQGYLRHIASCPNCEGLLAEQSK
jgi:8-oxo-dGTP pyrophosphatase MutT (NUDIX family)